jgi:geranylgeranylglycerol-phosphate geranylgeranyltransferase
MIKVWLALTRPLNVFITFCAVFIGALITGFLTPLSNLLVAMASAALICAGGNALNDYFDIEIDRINKPHRPLPSGAIKRSHALLFALILMAAGLSLSFFINENTLIIALVAILLLTAYNGYLKRNGGLLGNFTVSITGALPIAYGGAAVNHLEAILFPTVFAFLFHLGREIIKDLEDVIGDTRAKSCSIPTRFSPRVSYRIGFVPLFVLFCITPLPYLFRWYSILYLLLVIPFVNLLLLASFFYFRKKLDPGNLHRLSMVLKLSMVFGLLSLIAGTLCIPLPFFS